MIEGDRDELLVRAGLMMAQPDQSAADSSAEIASLRAENADLRGKLADANAEIEKLRAKVGRADAEIERLKSALHEKVVEEIAAKLVASGETKPTCDDVALPRPAEGPRSTGLPIFDEKEIAQLRIALHPERQAYPELSHDLADSARGLQYERCSGSHTASHGREESARLSSGRQSRWRSTGRRRPNLSNGTQPIYSKFVATVWLRQLARRHGGVAWTPPRGHPDIAPSRYDRIEGDGYLTLDAPWVVPSLLRSVPEISGRVLEPAAGRGHISLGLRRAGFDVVSRDIRRCLVPLIDGIGVGDLRALEFARRIRLGGHQPPYRDLTELTRILRGSAPAIAAASLSWCGPSG